MLRLSYAEDTGHGLSKYKSFLCGVNDTPFQILSRLKVNPETHNIYLNGKQVSNQKMNTPFRELVSNVTTIFMTARKRKKQP